MLYLKAKTFYLSEGVRQGGYLALDGSSFGVWQKELLPDQNTAQNQILDFSDFRIAPGLVDTHIHGRVGADVMDSTQESLAKIAQDLPRQGVTSWLATTLTEPTDALEKACAEVSAYKEVQEAEALVEARIEGIFLEGPFFTEKHKGAQNPDFLCAPDFQKLEVWQEAARGAIKKIAIAPEYAEAPTFTQEAVNRGICVGLAHTDATAEEALACVAKGASIFIHTYNGMSGLDHRRPGVVAAALLSAEDTYAELICDGNHVHPLAAEIVKNVKGASHTVLVSDCIRAGGLADGPSKLGELDVVVQNGQARLKESGSLAGSTIGLLAAVQNVVRWQIATPEEALSMASSVPALANNLDRTCGVIAPGRRADFLVLDDDLSLRATYIGGVKAYDQKDEVAHL